MDAVLRINMVLCVHEATLKFFKVFHMAFACLSSSNNTHIHSIVHHMHSENNGTNNQRVRVRARETILFFCVCVCVCICRCPILSHFVHSSRVFHVYTLEPLVCLTTSHPCCVHNTQPVHNRTDQNAKRKRASARSKSLWKICERLCNSATATDNGNDVGTSATELIHILYIRYTNIEAYLYIVYVQAYTVFYSLDSICNLCKRSLCVHSVPSRIRKCVYLHIFRVYICGTFSQPPCGRRLWRIWLRFVCREIIPPATTNNITTNTEDVIWRSDSNCVSVSARKSHLPSHLSAIHCAH